MDYEIESNNRIIMERPEPTYYAKIPKMAQLDLEPYELALYTNYKQTAGEKQNGASWKSNETLAKECKMSVRKIIQCRQKLVEKGYIIVEYKTNASGVIFSTATVTVIDVWAKNHEQFAPPAPDAHPPCTRCTQRRTK